MRKVKHPNTYIPVGEITTIQIFSEKHGSFNVLIDTEDLDKVQNYQWCVSKPYSPRMNCDMFYISTSNKKAQHKLLHRLIVDCSAGMVVDHIDGDTMNNRRSNLRICTRQQNNMNRRTYPNNTSGHRGVHHTSERYKYKNRWLANIKVNRKLICLGYFATFEEAVAAREAAEQKYYGEYVRD